MAELGFYVVSFRDYDGELCSTRILSPVLTEANFAAQALLRSDYRSGLSGLVLGVSAHHEYGNEQLLSLARPTGANAHKAQRELKWRIDYRDLTNLKLYHITVGTADTSLLDPNDRAHAHIGDADYVDYFVEKFNAYALSPAGHAVEVEEITLVGRNL